MRSISPGTTQARKSSPLKYRPDIDGLRALAILPVLFFHYQIPGTRGGFLGVDIFFVISGYLITKIVNDEISAGHFSVRRFYERRVRRIFPALFAVLAAVLAVGAVTFLPGELERLGRSMLATTLFVSNVYFYATDSYFGPVSAHEPLLHTWSLAVEEQFYLLFPLSLLLLRRNGWRFTLLVLWLVAGGSFAADVWLLHTHPTAAFYLPIPRAWELLCGSLVALDLIPAVADRRIREILGVAGLLAIFASVALCRAIGGSPVPVALYPCLGAICLILAGGGGGSVTSRVLALPPFVSIGKISYSLYLWHWPVLVVYLLMVKEHLPFGDKVAAIALSIGIAACSYRFIERPFRVRAGAGAEPARPVLAYTGATMAAAAAIGVMLVGFHGFAWRFPPDVNRLASYVRYSAPSGFRSGTCFLEPIESGVSFKDFAAGTCLARKADRRNFLLLGDSHAAHLWSGLSRVYPDINFMQATVAGCAPLLNGVSTLATTETKTCRELMQFAFRAYLPAHKLDGVILSAQWRDADVAPLLETVAFLRAYEPNIFVVGPIVEYTEPLPRILALARLRRDPDLARKHQVRSLFALDAKMENALAGTGVGYISMNRTLCPNGACRTVTDAGVPLQFDADHLTAAGSQLVASAWRAAGTFEPAGPRAAAITGRLRLGR